MKFSASSVSFGKMPYRVCNENNCIHLCSGGEGQEHGPVFLMEPPPRLLFSNSSGARVACAAHGFPPPLLAWQLPDGTQVDSVAGLRSVTIFISIRVSFVSADLVVSDSFSQISHHFTFCSSNRWGWNRYSISGSYPWFTLFMIFYPGRPFECTNRCKWQSSLFYDLLRQFLQRVTITIRPFEVPRQFLQDRDICHTKGSYKCFLGGAHCGTCVS